MSVICRKDMSEWLSETSLVTEWIRTHLPVQKVQSLVQKMPHAMEQLSPVPQLLKPEPRSPGSIAKEATSRRRPCTSGKSSTPSPYATRESSCAATKIQSNQN